MGDYRLITAKEIGEMLNISRPTVYKVMNRNRITKFGKNYMRAEVEALLEGRLDEYRKSLRGE